MSKEKKWYFTADAQMTQGDYFEALTTSITQLPRERLDNVILELAKHELEIQFRFIARLVPMSMDNTVVFLQNVVQAALRGQDILDSAAQADISRVTGALMEKAKEQVGGRDLLGAGCICFAIIKVVEPHLTNLNDEGELLRVVVGDAFDLLKALPREYGDAHVFSLLALMAGTLLNETVEENRHYAREWKELVGVYHEYYQSD
jgi:hypothetical protein